MRTCFGRKQAKQSRKLSSHKNLLYIQIFQLELGNNVHEFYSTAVYH